MRLLLDILLLAAEILWIAVEVLLRMVELALSIMCAVLLFDIFCDGIFGD